MPVMQWISDFRDWATDELPIETLKGFNEFIKKLEAMVAPPAPEEFFEYEKSEKRIQKELRLAAQDMNGMLLRNNSGVAREPDAHKGIRVIRYGLGNTSVTVNRRFKSSDLIGILPVFIGKEHLGRKFGVFVAVETKKPGFKFRLGGERTMAQANFLMTVNNLGGLGIFATGPEDLRRENEKRF